MLRCCSLGFWIALSSCILVVQTGFPSSEVAAQEFCTIYQGTMVAPMCRTATEGFAVFVNCLSKFATIVNGLHDRNVLIISTHISID
ncbi:hypothetical protein AHF37_11659 [Paragonimus kellicotti]|nr:hypothetical protein AHF37_11659 [Paragonimus kellicotti]